MQIMIMMMMLVNDCCDNDDIDSNDRQTIMGPLNRGVMVMLYDTVLDDDNQTIKFLYCC